MKEDEGVNKPFDPVWVLVAWDWSVPDILIDLFMDWFF